MKLYRDRPSGTVDRARGLRRDAPEPERRLLRGLRDAFPQLKWRHQTPLGPYYADLFCFSEKLVIEVDGETHATTAADDVARDAWMVRSGYQVLRFGNADVMTNVEGVLTQVSLALREEKGARAAQPRGRAEGDRREKGESA